MNKPTSPPTSPPPSPPLVLLAPLQLALFPSLLCLLLALLLTSPPAAAADKDSYGARPEVRAFVAAMHQRLQIDAVALQALFDKTKPLASVLRAATPQADPGRRSWRDYRRRFVEKRRIRDGLAFWRRHAATLARAQRLSGAPAEVIVAIIGVESSYGRITGSYNTFAALTTLAFDHPRRSALFRRELEALLLLSRETGRRADAWRGSWAGAIGLPQFLPSSIRSWAVDFDNDGRINLGAAAADAIGSVANYLQQHGWRAGEPIMRRVRLKPGADVAPLLAEGILPQRLPAQLAAAGVSVDAAAPQLPAALIDLASPDAATEYWLGYNNFYVITRYNRSSFYAMAVAQLAAELKARRRAAAAS